MHTYICGPLVVLRFFTGNIIHEYALAWIHNGYYIVGHGLQYVRCVSSCGVVGLQLVVGGKTKHRRKVTNKAKYDGGGRTDIRYNQQLSYYLSFLLLCREGIWICSLLHIDCQSKKNDFFLYYYSSMYEYIRTFMSYVSYDEWYYSENAFICIYSMFLARILSCNNNVTAINSTYTAILIQIKRTSERESKCAART